MLTPNLGCCLLHAGGQKGLGLGSRRQCMLCDTCSSAPLDANRVGLASDTSVCSVVVAGLPHVDAQRYGLKLRSPCMQYILVCLMWMHKHLSCATEMH